MEDPERIMIEIYRDGNLLDQKPFAGPTKPAGEILDRLKDIQMVGELRQGAMCLSASDMLKSTSTYQLHLAQQGVQACFEMSPCIAGCLRSCQSACSWTSVHM